MRRRRKLLRLRQPARRARDDDRRRGAEPAEHARLLRRGSHGTYQVDPSIERIRVSSPAALAVGQTAQVDVTVFAPASGGYQAYLFQTGNARPGSGQQISWTFTASLSPASLHRFVPDTDGFLHASRRDDARRSSDLHSPGLRGAAALHDRSQRRPRRPGLRRDRSRSTDGDLDAERDSDALRDSDDDAHADEDTDHPTVRRRPLRHPTPTTTPSRTRHGSRRHSDLDSDPHAHGDSYENAHENADSDADADRDGDPLADADAGSWGDDVHRLLRPRGFDGPRQRMVRDLRRPFDRQPAAPDRVRGDGLHGGPAGRLGATQIVSADFASSGNASAPSFGVVLRYQNTGNYYRVYRATGGSSLLRISKVVNGAETVLKSISLANPAPNVFFRLEGRVSGTALTVALDGVDKGSILDSTFVSGAVGVVIHSGGGTTPVHRADNFRATLQ